MTADRTPPPRDWPGLLAFHATMPNGSLLNFAYFLREFERHDVTSPMFGPPFYRAAGSLCRAVLFGEDGELARTASGELARRAREIVESDSPTVGRLEDHNLAAVAALSLAECAGWESTPPPVDVPLDRLLVIAPEADEYRLPTIWAHLAYGRVSGIDAVLYEDPTTAPPDPDEQVDASVFHVQRQVARCIAHDVNGELALSAWRAYLTHFPIDLAAESVTYPELIWAARTVHVVIGGADPSTVVDWLVAEYRGRRMSAMLDADLSYRRVREMLVDAGWHEVPTPGLLPPLLVGEPELARFERGREALTYTFNPAVRLRLVDGNVPPGLPTLSKSAVLASLGSPDPETALRSILGTVGLGWTDLVDDVRAAVGRLPADLAQYGRAALAELAVSEPQTQSDPERYRGPR